MAGLNEVSGLELIERISKEALKKRASAERVWSEPMRCWGFFSKKPCDLDRVIIIGAAQVGDMILPDGCIVWKPVDLAAWEPYKTIPPQSMGLGVIISKGTVTVDGNTVIKVSFLLGGDSAGMYDIFIQQSTAFKELWNLA
jgi:hypothetical protein